MPGVHKNNTISFRPSEFERILIEERAALSGMPKKDFIARSCIYSNICVVGSPKNIQRIVDSVEEMRFSVQETASRLTAGGFLLKDETLREMGLRYCAMCMGIVEILDGASYLFGNKGRAGRTESEKEEQIRQLLETLDFDCQNNTGRP